MYKGKEYQRRFARRLRRAARRPKKTPIARSTQMITIAAISLVVSMETPLMFADDPDFAAVFPAAH